MVEGDRLVALVGERRAGLGEVRRHRLLTVVHLPRGDDLVAGVVEGRHRHVELVTVLGLHVLADQPLAVLAQLGLSHWASCIALATATTNSTSRSSWACTAGPCTPWAQM